MTGAVAAFLAGPLDLAGEVGPVGGDQAGAFVVEHLFLVQEAEDAVAVVSGGEIVFADKTNETSRARRAGRVRLAPSTTAQERRGPPPPRGEECYPTGLPGRR